MSEPIQVDFGNDKSRKTSGSSSQEVLIPPDRSGLKIVIDFIITAVVGAVIYYFWLPPMNFHSPDFYIFWAVIAGVFILSVFLTSSALIKPEYVPYAKKRSKIPLIIVIALVVIFAIGWLVGCQLFRAKSYSSLLSVDENTDFNKSVTVIDSTKDFKNVPMVDSTASETLADKVLGDLAELRQYFQVDKQHPWRIHGICLSQYEHAGHAVCLCRQKSEYRKLHQIFSDRAFPEKSEENCKIQISSDDYRQYIF